MSNQVWTASILSSVRRLPGRLANRSRTPYLLFGVFVAAILAVNSYWIVVNTTPPAWDQSWYLETSVVLYRTLSHQGPAAFAAAFADALGGIKPPLITILPIPFYYLLGPHEDAAALVCLGLIVTFNVFLFALIASRSSARHALFTVVITSKMPIYLALSHQFLVDYGVGTLTLIWTYLLLKSDLYANRKVDVLLGVALGLGLLIKFLFPLYAIAQGLVIFVARLRRDPLRSWPRIALDVAIVLGTAFLVAGTWYVPNWRAAVEHGLSAGVGEIAGNYSMGNVLAWSTISTYWRSLFINWGMSSYTFALLLVLLLAFVVKRLLRPARPALTLDGVVFGAWFLVPFTVLTLGTNKDGRWLLPILPVIGYLVAYLFFRVFTSARSTLLAAAVLTVPLLLAAYMSSPIAWVNTRLSFHKFILVPDKTWENQTMTSQPRAEGWPLEEILASIDADAGYTPGKWASIQVVADHPYLNRGNFAFSRTLHGWPLEVRGIAYLPPQMSIDEILALLAESEYLICKTGYQGPAFTTTRNEAIAQALEQGTLPFRLLAAYPLPDQSEARVYKRNPAP